MRPILQSMYKYTFKKIFRDWALIISMIVGVCTYLIYRDIPSIHSAGPILETIAKTVQPIMLFMMLFVSFSKIEARQMRPHKWMLWLLLAQTLCFIGIIALIYFVPDIPLRLGWEAFMLCMICPTATACAVITAKLGGNIASVVTYTVIINLAVSLLIPLFVPLIHPIQGLTFSTAFSKIIAKVFPLLISPCLLAWIVRYLFPKFHKFVLGLTNLPFYLWLISLSIAMLMSTRAIYHSDRGAIVLIEIGIASLLSCVFQFWFGRKIGKKYGCHISSAQALGQKNTVFAIWLGYTFLDPVVSVAGGIYSIWHNSYNTYQMYKRRKSKEEAELQ